MQDTLHLRLATAKSKKQTKAMRTIGFWNSMKQVTFFWESVTGGSGADLLESIYQDHNRRILVAGRSCSMLHLTSRKIALAILTTGRSCLIQQESYLGKTISGDGLDMLYDIAQLRDSSYVFSGHSRSGISGNKSTLNRETSTTGWLVWMNTATFPGKWISVDPVLTIQNQSARNRYGEIIGGYSECLRLPVIKLNRMGRL